MKIFFKKIFSTILVFSLLSTAYASTQNDAIMLADATIINEKGVHDGYNWEAWSGSNQGYVEIIPKSNGSFSCNWKETEEASFSVGKVYGSSGSSIETLGEIEVNYLHNTNLPQVHICD